MNARSVRFVIDVELDTAVIEREGQRAGLPLQRARESLLADVESRLDFAIRHRDGVSRVAIRLATYGDTAA